MRLTLLSVFAFLLLNCQSKAQETKKSVNPAVNDSAYIAQNYVKKEYKIPMRDGTNLFTAVYSPKDQSNKYPIMLQRTCYSVRPYGEKMKKRMGPSSFLMRDGYIFVYQDVRGRWMSEGKFDNM
ncbi:MAG: putative acyl esterase, partial [Arenicella sp.]